MSLQPAGRNVAQTDAPISFLDAKLSRKLGGSCRLDRVVDSLILKCALTDEYAVVVCRALHDGAANANPVTRSDRGKL